jgi:hypothetical protein
MCGGVSATGTCIEGPRPFCSVFLISAMMTSSSFAGIGEVDRYGPFIHSGLDRPNHELNAFSAAEASASLAFRRHRGFPIAAGLGFGGWSYYDSCIIWTGYNWVNVCY